MDPRKKVLALAGWMSALFLALALMGTDTLAHYRTTQELTHSLQQSTPQADPASPSGYAGGQHEVILPYTGLDGFHWVMQTQEMLAGAGLRVRSVDYDNAPDGREVHWSSLLRWWLAVVAWFDHMLTGAPLPQAVEGVVPFANTLLMGLIILAVTPVVARRFGAGIAALLAFGMVAVGPFYESYAAGRGDHHGLAAVSAWLTLLLLVGGGGGWVLAPPREAVAASSAPDESAGEEGESNDVTDAALRAWIPQRAQARRWFIASGVVGGIGLWVSAASQAPVLCGIGLGVLMAGVLGRQVRDKSVARPDPTLWRVWGFAGAAASVLFYLLEYFPAHFGLRLEVNHPLYALAWAGGGEILYRVCAWLDGEKLAPTARDRVGLAAAFAGVLLLPAVILLFPGKTFWVLDPFLYSFHKDYIIEFWPLWTYLASQPMAMFIVMANPLVLLAVLMFAWSWRRGRTALLWAVAPMVALCGWFLWKWSGVTQHHMGWCFALACVAGALVFLSVWSRWPKFPRPARALMFLAIPPCVLSFALALWQVRWVEISYGLWLAGLVAAAQAIRLHPNFRWTATRKFAAVALLVWVLLPGPALMLYSWTRNGLRSPPSREEFLELVGRNIAQTLRARLGDKPGVVLSDPTTTTWLIYFGGLKGLGTFYWENLAGLKASADIYAAKSEDEALKLLQQHGVQYLVLPSWSAAAEEFARADRGLPKNAPAPADAFVLHMLKTPAFPRWVRPVIFEMPPLEPYKHDKVIILEIVPNQTPEEALARFAEWLLQSGNREGALTNANAALMVHSNYLPALLLGARLQYSAHASSFATTVGRIRAQLAQADKLAFEDRVDLALVLSLAGDGKGAQQQLAACIKDATDDDLHRLRPDALFNLLSLSRMSGLLETRPGWWPAAAELLPRDKRAHFYFEYAVSERQAGHFAQAVALLREALALEPDSTSIMSTLGWILATTPDDAVRNGPEALALAQKADTLENGRQYTTADLLACAYADCGDYDKAIAAEQRAIAGAEAEHATDLAQQFQDRLQLFRDQHPYRDLRP